MINADRTTQSKASRSFAQEMQQAFAEWVRKLPFMKRTIHEDTDQESPDGALSEQAPDPRPADDVRASEPVENK